MQAVNIEPSSWEWMMEKLLAEYKTGNLPVHCECGLIGYLKIS